MIYIYIYIYIDIQVGYYIICNRNIISIFEKARYFYSFFVFDGVSFEIFSKFFF